MYNNGRPTIKKAADLPLYTDPQARRLEMRMLKQALADKIMERFEPGFLQLDEQSKAKFIRLALIDDPTDQLIQAAMPVVTDLAKQVGLSAWDYIASWWNPGPQNSIVPYDPQFAQAQISSIPGAINPMATNTMMVNPIQQPSAISTDSHAFTSAVAKQQNNIVYEEAKYNYDAVNSQYFAALV